MILELLLVSVAHAKEVCIGSCDEAGLQKPRIERMTHDNEKRNVQSDSRNEGRSHNMENQLEKKNETSRKKSNAATRTSHLYVDPDEETNLPRYFKDLPASGEHEFVFTPKTEANDVLFGFTKGSKIKVIIRQNIVASPNVPTPVVGEIITESLKGAFLYGDATLENDLKRVIIKFSHLGGGILNAQYSIKGMGLDPQGRVGVEGNFHSEDLKYGIASFLSTGAAIAVDSQVERSQNITGGYSEAPSVSNAVKKGVAGTLGKVADRMATRAEQVPGYTEIEGPIYMTVVLDDKPKTNR